jgi:hypothetical protein
MELKAECEGIVLLILAALSMLLTGCAHTQQNPASLDKTRHENCTLTVAEAPAVEGFKLASGLDDLRNRFPELPFTTQLEFEKKTILPKVRLQTKDLVAEDVLPLRDIKLFGSSAMYKVLGGEQEGGYLVNKDRHPEFEEIAYVTLQYHRARLYKFQVNYELQPQRETREALAEYITTKINFPYTLSVHDDWGKDLMTECKQSNQPRPAFAFFVGVPGEKLRPDTFPKFPFVSLLDVENFIIADRERRPIEAELSRLNKAKVDASMAEADAILKAPRPPSVEELIAAEKAAKEKGSISKSSVVIAGTTVSVGQDAYISQDRLEQYRLRTVGNIDTYSYAGKTYEITYGPGERGAYFVKSIKIIP